MRVKWDQFLHPVSIYTIMYTYFSFCCNKNQFKPNSFPGDPVVLFQQKKNKNKNKTQLI